MGEISGLWGIAWGVGTIIAIIAITVYMTRRNTSVIDSLKQNEIAELYSKVNTKMDEDKARETFVTKEVNTEQMKHIDTSIGEIKEYQKEILGYLRK